MLRKFQSGGTVSIAMSTMNGAFGAFVDSAGAWYVSAQISPCTIYKGNPTGAKFAGV